MWHHSTCDVVEIVGLVVVCGEAVVSIVEICPCFGLDACGDLMHGIYHILQDNFKRQVQACCRKDTSYKITFTLEDCIKDVAQVPCLHRPNEAINVCGDPVIAAEGH